MTSLGSFHEILAIAGDQLLVDQVLPARWSARYHFAADGTHLRLVRIEITPGQDAGPISTVGLRRLSPVAAEYTARRLARENPAVLHLSSSLQGTDQWAGLTGLGAKGAAMDDLQLAGVALEYVRAIEQGERAPAAKIAALVGGVSPVQARDYIRRARSRGLLTEGTHGRAGGALTDKAIALLAPLIEQLGALAAQLDHQQKED